MNDLEGFHDVSRWHGSLKHASVDELADRLSIKHSLDSGIAFYRSRSYKGSAKAHARHLILARMGWRRYRQLNILTMPGLKWIFEHQVLSQREHGPDRKNGTKSPRNTRFVCIERNEYIYRAALMKMPGAMGGNGIVQVPTAEFASCSVRTRIIGRYHRCSFEDYARAYAAKGISHLDFAWLDFSGPMTRERVDLIEKLWTNNLINHELIVTATTSRSELGSFDVSKWLAGLGELTMEHGYQNEESAVPMIQVGIKRKGAAEPSSRSARLGGDPCL